jgi:hypothetical protein
MTGPIRRHRESPGCVSASQPSRVLLRLLRGAKELDDCVPHAVPERGAERLEAECPQKRALRARYQFRSILPAHLRAEQLKHSVP